MNVLVCGGRNYSDRTRAYAELDRVCFADGNKDVMLIIGGANGADKLAADWFFARLSMNRDYLMHVQTFPADWKKYGKAAGPIRNQQMIDEAKPELVVAFPGGRGTEDMVRRARAAAIPVVSVNR